MLSEELRHLVELIDVDEKYRDTILKAADLLDVYYIQCKAVTGADRLGQAKVYVRHALAEEDK